MLVNEITCDQGYIRYDPLFEFFIEKRKFHGDASDINKMCRIYNGGKLAVFDSDEKRTFLRNQLFKTGKFCVINRPKHVERKIEYCGG